MRSRRVISPMILMVLILLTVAGVKQTFAQSSIKFNRAPWLLLLLSDSGGQPQPTTSRVSVATMGAQGNNSSDTPSISSDGHYVAFESLASNLVSGDTNGFQDIFVHDRY
jgi:hypothetical protein